MEKDTSKYKGSVKSDARLKMEEFNIAELLDNNTLKQLADRFEVDLNTVSRVISDQFKERKIGFDVAKKNYIPHIDWEYESRMLALPTDGVWMKSENRIFGINNRNI